MPKRKSTSVETKVVREASKRQKLKIIKEKESLAKKVSNIEIINLNEDLCTESQSENDEWEDVSEIEPEEEEEAEKVIVIKLNNESDECLDIIDEKYNEQKREREKREFLHRMSLMSLFARVLYVNRICQKELIQNVALSVVSKELIDLDIQQMNEQRIRGVVDQLLRKLILISDWGADGNVSQIILDCLNECKANNVWFNVIFSIILNVVGFNTRLVAMLYPLPLKSTVSKQLTSHKFSNQCKSRQNRSHRSIISPTEVVSHQSQPVVFHVEVLNPDTLRWIPFDGIDINSWNNISLIVRMRPKFLYAIAVTEDGYMRDVAPQYDTAWANASRRQRLSDSSYSRLLSHFLRSKPREEDIIEDICVKQLLLDQDIPKTLADIKNHPIYVLRKHMLKYEVLFPVDVSPCGFIRDEPIFLREHVLLAHTKETWLKEAMQIKPGEVPCKRVKTMMSTKKHKEIGGDPFVDLYGPWQVEKYVPPIAENGVVPRNEFNNVNLFQSSMLPVGCVHIRLPDIDRIAVKLGIDCAPAMVGWAFTKHTRARPVLDGFIVCTENIPVLKSAWQEWKLAEFEKQREKRRINIYKRWKVLTRRLLLAERLRLEYNS